MYFTPCLPPPEEDKNYMQNSENSSWHIITMLEVIAGKDLNGTSRMGTLLLLLN